MKISCVACHHSFQVAAQKLDVNGSMVRCLECNYIFMVYPPKYSGSPVTQDTNIEQSILDDLLEMQTEQAAWEPADDISKQDRNKVDNEFGPVGNPDSGADDTEYAELPDLSEYENMIDWDDINDSDDSIPKSNPNANDTQNLDINSA